MKTITRMEAARKGLMRYFTGKPCAHGHIAERYVVSMACLQCNKVRVAKYHQKVKAIIKDAREEAAA
jgi:hypothetical protein